MSGKDKRIDRLEKEVEDLRAVLSYQTELIHKIVNTLESMAELINNQCTTSSHKDDPS